jgi:hypothetical protein
MATSGWTSRVRLSWGPACEICDICYVVSGRTKLAMIDSSCLEQSSTEASMLYVHVGTSETSPRLIATRVAPTVSRCRAPVGTKHCVWA